MSRFTPLSILARAIIVALVLMIGAPTALAQGEDNQQAQDWYKLAMTAYKEGRMQDAAMAFDAAYRSDPAAELLYNAGRAYEKAGVPDRAVERYRAFLIEKAADPGLREKAMNALVSLQLAQQQREAEANKGPAPPPSTANSKLQLQLAEAERRRLQLELQLEAERRAQAAASGERVEVSEAVTNATPDTAFVQIAFSGDTEDDLVLRDPANVKHVCASNSAGCAFDVTPGRSTFQMYGLDDGERFATLHAGRSYIYEAEVIRMRRLGMGQIAGAAVGGCGALIALLGLPLVTSEDDLYILAGVSGAVVAAGAALWFLSPPAYTTSLRLNESRMTTDSGGVLDSLQVTAAPVDGGMVVGATGSF